MIKPEWIKESNGFRSGERVLYLDHSKPEFSAVFVLKRIEDEHYAPRWEKHPTDKRMYVLVTADSSKYGTPMYLEADGDLYPMDDPRFQLWGPASGDAHFFSIGIIEGSHVGTTPWRVPDYDGCRDELHIGPSKVIHYTNNGEEAFEARRGGHQVYDRPDWAVRQ